MSLPLLVENVRNLIVSHVGHDEAGFRKSAEAIARELSVDNRPSEARAIRDVLSRAPAAGATSSTWNSLATLTKSTAGLMTWVERPPRADLIFKPETGFALRQVIAEHRQSARLAEAGLQPKKRLLFWGPPGCGKTASAAWLAHELNVPFGVVRLGALISSLVGETGANLQRVLGIAGQVPMVLLIDEADAVAKTRDDVNDVGEFRRVVNALLQGLDAFQGKRSIVVLATNHSHAFDGAVWRRFDDVVGFSLPNYEERSTHLRHLTSGLEMTGSLPAAARSLDGCSFADIERAVFEAAKDKVLSDSSEVSFAQVASNARSWHQKISSATAPVRASPSTGKKKKEDSARSKTTSRKADGRASKPSRSTATSRSKQATRRQARTR